MLAVIVKQVSDVVCQDDEGLEGVYEITLSDDVAREFFANAALDIFHESVPVANLEDFEFHVELDGKPIEEGDTDSYTLGHTGNVGDWFPIGEEV